MKVSTLSRLLGPSLLLLPLLLPGYTEAEQIYVKVQGSRQGAFKGESVRPGTQDKFEAVKFSYEIVSPRDTATGQATGKRQHRPIVLTKQLGAASPQLFTALVTNELLPAVQIDFVGVAPGTGQEQLLRTIKLTNAFVASDKQFTEGAQAQMRLYEELSFVFQRIEITDLVGKTTAMDDWSAVP